MSTSPRTIPLRLSIFRLEDVCVRVQDGMEGFLRTAALQKTPQIEATFRWLRKRGFSIALLSDHDRESTEILLQRLGWAVGEDRMVQLLLTSQTTYPDPLSTVLELMGHTDGSTALSVLDTPDLLELAHGAKVKFNLGVTNGRCGYGQLATAPHHALLDGPVQLPNYLLQQLPPEAFPPLGRTTTARPGLFSDLQRGFLL